MCFCEFLIPKVYCIVLFLLASEIRAELYLKSSVLSEWSNALSVELCIGPGGTRNRCFLCKLPELLYGKFIFNVSVHNWSLFTWSLTAFPGNWQRATNKAMLPAGYISSRLWQPRGRHWGRTLGIFFFPQETGSEGNKQIPQNSESKHWSACHHTLSPGTNGPLQGEWATHHVQPCLLDMECFSMMAVRRSSEKRWSRFSWPAVCPLMWGDAVDGCGWCESWKLFHRSRLYRKDHQRSQSQRGWVCQKTWDVTDF